MRFTLIPILIAMLWLIGCGEQPTIQRFEVMPPVGFDWPDTPAREAAHDVDGLGWAWDVPAGWMDAPEVPDRLIADYRLKGSDELLPGRVTVSKIDGDAGGVDANVMRWLGQIYVTTPSGLGAKDKVDPMPIGINTLTFVDLHGQYQGEHHPTRIWAAIIQIPAKDGGVFQTWFFKMAGDDATIERNRRGMAQMVLTFRPKGTPRPSLPGLDDEPSAQPVEDTTADQTAEPTATP